MRSWRHVTIAHRRRSPTRAYQACRVPISATEILVTVRRQLEGSEPSEGLLPAASGSACFWAGVACDPLGAVTSLDFSSQGLSGTLPAQLAGLAGLQSL